MSNYQILTDAQLAEIEARDIAGAPDVDDCERVIASHRAQGEEIRLLRGEIARMAQEFEIDGWACNQCKRLFSDAAEYGARNEQSGDQWCTDCVEKWPYHCPAGHWHSEDPGTCEECGAELEARAALNTAARGDSQQRAREVLERSPAWKQGISTTAIDTATRGEAHP